MASLRLEVRISRSPELEAHAVLQAIRALESGDRSGALRGYHEVRATRFAHPDSWSNLSALAIALDDVEGARQYASRALQIDAVHAGALVNLGVASWHAGMRRDAARTMHQALQQSPGLEVAALNYAQMLRTVDRLAQAHATLVAAALANRRSWRLQLRVAETARLLGLHEDARRHVLKALDAIPIQRVSPEVLMPSSDGVEAGEAGNGVIEALLVTADALSGVGVPFHLIGGTLLAIYRDGNPFPHDKDIDLGLPFDADRNIVRSALAVGFSPVLRPESPQYRASSEWVMGFTHEPTGIGVDLMFVQQRGAHMRFELGWPDHLACEVPAYALETLTWRNREWSVPSPPEVYLTALYGPDWNGEVHGRGFDRRYFDTQVSNPSRTADSLPRAVTLALLRLVEAVRTGQWAKADALGMQILAREDLAEVRRLRARLPKPVTGPA